MSGHRPKQKKGAFMKKCTFSITQVKTYTPKFK